MVDIMSNYDNAPTDPSHGGKIFSPCDGCISKSIAERPVCQDVWSDNYARRCALVSECSFWFDATLSPVDRSAHTLPR